MSVVVKKAAEGMPEKRPIPAAAHPLLGLREDIDRLFGDFFAAPFGRLVDLEPFRRIGLMPSLGEVAPYVDVRETETAIEITAELPGMAEKDVEVTVGDGVLSLKGEKKGERDEKGADWHLTERRYGAFHRTFRLPDTVDADRIAAVFDKGLLTLTLPKIEKPAKEARRIEVKGK
jgi:HSP20 family protein